MKIFRAFWQEVFISGYQVVDDVTRDIGQAVVMAGLAVGELFMVQPLSMGDGNGVIRRLITPSCWLVAGGIRQVTRGSHGRGHLSGGGQSRYGNT